MNESQSLSNRPSATSSGFALEPLLPAAKSVTGRGRKRTVNLREIVNAILYLSRSGCAWELLPHDFPPPKTVYSYFRKWNKQGVWQRIHQTLRQQVRQKAGRCRQASAGIIDSQSVKTTDVGGAERGFDGGKKVNGRKRHILVDTLGLMLAVKRPRCKYGRRNRRTNAVSGIEFELTGTRACVG